MPYARKHHKPDIRSLSFKTENLATQTAEELAVPQTNNQILVQHNPAHELRRILFITAPLFIALILATYYDHTKHWVVPFAERLLSLGK